MTMTECARCGSCCVFIGWGMGDPQAAQKLAPQVEREKADPGDAAFIADHWRYCPGVGYWWCSLFDFETNLCGIHHLAKPRVCSGYPWYGEVPRQSHNLNEGCAYRADVARVFGLLKHVAPSAALDYPPRPSQRSVAQANQGGKA
jgi:Fe-S-cluster containining protein